MNDDGRGVEGEFLHADVNRKQEDEMVYVDVEKRLHLTGMCDISSLSEEKDEEHQRARKCVSTYLSSFGAAACACGAAVGVCRSRPWNGWKNNDVHVYTNLSTYT